jgi:hypothetical protein
LTEGISETLAKFLEDNVEGATPGVGWKEKKLLVSKAGIVQLFIFFTQIPELKSYFESH